MDIYIDSADKTAIDALTPCLGATGITTNPRVLREHGISREFAFRQVDRDPFEAISIQSTQRSTADMIEDGLFIAQLGARAVVKLPISVEALVACRELTGLGVRVNMTVCVSTAQCMLAAAAGAWCVSLFLSRISDRPSEVEQELRRAAAAMSGVPTRLLVASVRTTEHLSLAAACQVDALTAKPSVWTNAIADARSHDALAAMTGEAHASS